MYNLEDLYHQIRKDLDLAIRANGGNQWSQQWCTCEPSVGNCPCEYCAIYRALDHFGKLLNIDNSEVE